MSHIITAANAVTLVRLLIIVPTTLAILNNHWRFAASLFVVAVITDLLDGRVARKRNETSAFGGILDHSTDALFVAAALGALAALDLANAILPVLVILAFAQYMLDSKALAGQHLRTSWLGRNNGIAYYVCVGIPVIRNGLGLDWPPDILVSAFAWLLVATTLVSMADRLFSWWRVPR